MDIKIPSIFSQWVNQFNKVSKQVGAVVEHLAPPLPAQPKSFDISEIPPTSEQYFVRVASDLPDVNDLQHCLYDPATRLRPALVERLPEKERGMFKKIQDIISNSPDTDVKVSLQNLLIRGSLNKQDSNGRTLLENLYGIATQPLGLATAKYSTTIGDRRLELLAAIIQELDAPTAINQKIKGTCPATTAQMLLAKNDPSEYARLILGLASVNGSVPLANGDLICRENDWFATNDDNRTITSRLIQPAFMDYGNGFEDYSNTEDLNYADGKQPHGGLYFNQSERLYRAVFNKDVQTDTVWSVFGLNNVDSLVQKINERLAQNKTVFAGVHYGNFVNDGHMINITSIQNGRVSYRNPWGREESMSLEEFKKRLIHTQSL